jgi:hypothetical protein
MMIMRPAVANFVTTADGFVLIDKSIKAAPASTINPEAFGLFQLGRLGDSQIVCQDSGTIETEALPVSNLTDCEKLFFNNFLMFLATLSVDEKAIDEINGPQLAIMPLTLSMILHIDRGAHECAPYKNRTSHL